MRHIVKRRHLAIYQSRVHLFITLILLMAPFVFLLFFSRIADIAISDLYSNFGVSLLRLFAAYIISVLIGWICALLFYKGRRSAVALPFFDILQSFPTFAILPLAGALLGAGDAIIIFFLVLTILWPIFFSILSSLRLVKRDWEEAATMAGWSGFAYLKRFLLPISIPGIITGSIIGLGEGWGALIATESIAGASKGLGSFFSAYAENSTVTTFGILGLLILIFSLNRLVWSPLLNWSHSMTEE